MLASITQSEVRTFLAEQMPTASAVEIERASSALVLILKLATTAGPPPKPATKKQRQYKEKSVAETLKLKR